VLIGGLGIALEVLAAECEYALGLRLVMPMDMEGIPSGPELLGKPLEALEPIW